MGKCLDFACQREFCCHPSGNLSSRNVSSSSVPLDNPHACGFRGAVSILDCWERCQVGILCGCVDGIGSKADPTCYRPLSCPRGLSIGKGHGNSWRFSVGCKLQCWLRWETPCCSSWHQQMSWDILSLDGAERTQGRVGGWMCHQTLGFFFFGITE